MPGDSAINLGMKEQNYSKSPRDGSQAEVMAEHSPLTEATKNWKMKPKTPTPRAASQGSGLKEDAHPQNMREFVPEPLGLCNYHNFIRFNSIFWPPVQQIILIRVSSPSWGRIDYAASAQAPDTW